MVLPEILGDPPRFVELYFGTGLAIYLFIAYLGFSMWAGVIRVVFIFVPEPAENLLSAFSNITIIIGFVYIKWLTTFSEGYTSGPKRLSDLTEALNRLHKDTFAYIMGNPRSASLIRTVDESAVEEENRIAVTLTRGIIGDFNRDRDIKNLLNNLTRVFRSAIRHLYGFYLSYEELEEKDMPVEDPNDPDPVREGWCHVFMSETLKKLNGRAQPSELDVLDCLVSVIQAIFRQLETDDSYLDHHHQSLVDSLNSLKKMVDDTRSQNRIRVPIFFESHVEFIIIFYMSVWLPLQVDFNGGWYSLGATPILLLMFLGPALIRQYIRDPFDPLRINNGMDYKAWRNDTLKDMMERFIEYTRAEHTQFAHQMHVATVNYEEIYVQGTNPIMEGVEIMDMSDFRGDSRHLRHRYRNQQTLRQQTLYGIDPRNIGANPFPIVPRTDDENDLEVGRRDRGAINRDTAESDNILIPLLDDEMQ